MAPAPGADWQLATTAVSAPYTGANAHTYAFRSRARDLAGNLEAYPTNPDASTVVDAVASATQVSASAGFFPGDDQRRLGRQRYGRLGHRHL